MIALRYSGNARTFRILLNVMASSALNNPGMTLMDFVNANKDTYDVPHH